jgi:putative DNA primase/helicase
MNAATEPAAFVRAMGPVARAILGEPSEENRAKRELRFGTRGSLCVDLSKGIWYDNEAGQGGGVLDFVQERKSLDKDAAVAWLQENGHLPPATPRKGNLGRIAATYDYVDAGGELLYQVLRLDPKDFRQRAPDGNQGWTWKVPAETRVLYRLPEVIRAIAEGRTIYIVEGEKAVDALESIGLVGTCSPGGAGKWRPRYNGRLAGSDVVILPDNDPQAVAPDGALRWHPDGRPVLPGQDHAADVAKHLRGVAAKVRVLMLPDLPSKGDVADWVASGGTREAMETLLAGSPPETDNAGAGSPERRRARGQVDDATPSHDDPPIRIVAGELHTSATDGESAIIAAGLPIYQRGGTLVRPISRAVTASRGRTTIAAGLGEIGVHGLIDVLCGCARWERFDARAGDWLRINPPVSVAQVVLARHGQWRLPPIAGVITTPTLRPDGSLLSTPGYDRATRLYYVADPNLQLHAAVINPTRAAAEGALRALSSLLSDFPLINDVARSVALSALVTPVVRGSLTVAPLHVFRANTAGSGKSYLADVASAIATGRPCPVISAAPDEGETEKRLSGLLLAGFPLISIDNVNGELGGDLLCQAIERPLIRLRRLGASDITEIESVSCILANGNNLRVRGDMVRRTIIADLDAQQERPELRTFKGDPVATVLADRGRFVSACLVIVRAYIQAGKPNPPAPLASFSDWSTLVRGALIWLGCADPAISMEIARKDDPELTELREMLTVWADALGSDAMTTAQVVAAIEARHPTQIGEPTDHVHPELREMLLRLFGERGTMNTRRLGKWLASKEGRIVGGRRFKRAATTGQNGVARWRIEMVQR